MGELLKSFAKLTNPLKRKFLNWKHLVDMKVLPTLFMPKFLP